MLNAVHSFTLTTKKAVKWARSLPDNESVRSVFVTSHGSETVLRENAKIYAIKGYEEDRALQYNSLLEGEGRFGWSY